MKTLYVGTYTEPHLFGLDERDLGVRIYLHCLDPNTYVLGDDIEGRCFNDVPVPAKLGEKVMAGDFSALLETSAEVAQLMGRPHFKFADSRIVTETDPSLLNSTSLGSAYRSGIRRR